MAPMGQGHINPTPVRLPKLTYRVRSPDNESINSNSNSNNIASVTTPTDPTSPLYASSCSSSRESAINRHSLSMRPPSITPSTGAKPSMATPKKKSGFLTGLFAKEPSAQALADYEKRLLKQGRNRTSTMGLPGVSSAKLPPTVPKVNSKWDGVPQTVKEREKQKQEHKKSMSGHSRNASTVRPALPETRPSSTSESQRRLSRGTLGGLSTHSNGSSNRLADLYGWESKPTSSSSSAIVDFAAAHRPATARMQSSHSAPPAPERSLPLERTSVFPPHTTLHPPASARPILQQPLPSPSNAPYPPSPSYSPALTPFESLPTTPEGTLPQTAIPSPLIGAKPRDDIKTTIVEAPAHIDAVIIKSAGLNILGPPAAAKRKPKVSPDQCGSNQPSAAGSDKPLTSILKKGAPRQPTTPTTSYFPDFDLASTVALQRRNSARDRLGLGVSMKNQGLAPWSSPNQVDDANGNERIITPTPESGHSLRKPRMSMFKK